jgi:hypothetical protein
MHLGGRIFKQKQRKKDKKETEKKNGHSSFVKNRIFFFLNQWSQWPSFIK